MRTDANLNYSDIESTMITSVYFYVTTLTTVGFGDIFPVLVGERIFIIFLIFLGIGMFSYILSEITHQINNYAASYECKINEKKEKLKEWIQKRDLARNNCEKDFKPGSKIENYFLFEWRFNYKDMIDNNQFSNKMTSGSELKVLT